MIMERNLEKIQIVIAIVAVLYVIMPDLFIGPIDDTALATIAVIAEVVLGVMRAVSKSESDYISDGKAEYF